MRFEGQQSYPAEPETLRQLLNDPVALRNIIPGCQTLEATSPNEYQLRLSLRIGQNIETFDGVLALDHASPTGDFTFCAAGTAANTAVTVNGRLMLNRQPGGETLLTYEADAAAETPLAISARLRQTTGRAFVRRCLENMAHQVAIAGGDAGAGNRVPLDGLNELDRVILKESLKQARRLQQRLKLNYGL